MLFFVFFSACIQIREEVKLEALEEITNAWERGKSKTRFGSNSSQLIIRSVIFYIYYRQSRIVKMENRKFVVSCFLFNDI